MTNINHTFALSLSPDQAYFVSEGMLPILLNDEDHTEDMKRLIIYSCGYESEEERAEGIQNMIDNGDNPDDSIDNAIVAIGDVYVKEYDEKLFQADRHLHRINTSLAIHKANIGLADAPLYAIEFENLYKMEKPILVEIQDVISDLIFLPETPFEELCFRLAVDWHNKEKAIGTDLNS